eukprot:TRINITY_DN2296_c0_g1_i4.p1 TRINITY_DN2296_c0_g1~~TRINITY_DN2296_c0_g1_i4.p1  ORF type:complete len:273 (-),score=44.69 TRINITY_DN2296_c0_g1_i4:81-899(-)
MLVGLGGKIPPTVKKQHHFSDAMRRTSDWLLSQEIPCDITIEAGGFIFAMHKFPLVSKCGYIHKLVAEGQGADNSILDLHDIPGGAESFELAAKFCYGINFEITTRNVAMLRCAAEYLGMTEEYADGNLIARTEVFLAEVALKTLTSAVTVLQSCEVLLPVAEELNIVSSCVETIVSRAIKDSHFSTSSRPSCAESEASINSHTKFMIDWWAEDLVILRIDFYQRVIQAMKGRGLSNASLGAALMFYAQKSLQGLVRKEHVTSALCSLRNFF